jgi:hypothetical protein
MHGGEWTLWSLTRGIGGPTPEEPNRKISYLYINKDRTRGAEGHNPGFRNLYIV